jgi:hypothetical protein
MGMPKIEFRTAMFRGDWDQIWSQERLLHLMEALCRVNQTHIRQMNKFFKRGLVSSPYPLLYRAGIHYEREKNGTEIWPDIPSLLSGVMGKGDFPGIWGDCEDLACWRVAELREMARNAPAGSPLKIFEKTKPFAKWRRRSGGVYAYHALVRLPDGQLEDPSLALGMGREAEFARENIAERYRSGEITPKIQFAEAPLVAAVDPEAPSGFAGGIAPQLNAAVVARLAKIDPEEGAYASNLIQGEHNEIDNMIGWDPHSRRFVSNCEKRETRRLLGYAAT